MLRTWQTLIALATAILALLPGARNPAAVVPAAAPSAAIHPIVETDADQVIVVSASAKGTPSATVAAYSWKNGAWRPNLGPFLAAIGTKGFTSDPHESDGYTPVGEYQINLVFGSMADPGTKFPYSRVTADDHWVDDPGSALYNTFQSRPSAGRWSSAESLSSYTYAVAFDFNQSPTIPGGNSAIFLHEGQGASAGCVQVGRSDLLAILRWLDPNARPAIILGVDATPPPHAAGATSAR